MQESSPNANLIAILCHFTWIGWIVALLLNNQERSYLGSFYLRQTIGIWLVTFLVIIRPLAPVIGILVIAMWIYSLVNAISKSTVPIPFIGEYFQDWFKGL
jgi:uncharacterized membrane protein